MKRSITLLVFIFTTLSSFASHIYGGEMIYEYISTNTVNNTKKYRITLRLFRDNLGGNNAAQLPNTVLIGIYDYKTKTHYPANLTSRTFEKTSGPTAVPVNISPCITGNVKADYSVAAYSMEVDLPINDEGYICSFETCCRVNSLMNVFHAGGTGGTGSTYVCRIPGTNQLEALKNNSSPQFVTSLDLVCFDRPFKWNFSATDPDGDELVYSFTPAYDKVQAQDANVNNPPQKPSSGSTDYPTVTYINGYSSGSPLGSRVSIDPKTGIISGIAPPLGQYVVAVLIREFRDGKQISEHRKDFILRVQDCDIASAELKTNYMVCDQPNATFKNEAPTSPLIKTYYWEFSYKGTIVGTSTLAQPNFNFPDTGVYDVKLIINRGDPCEVEATSIARVYPGFVPEFDFNGVCTQKPTQFTDRSTTKYGSVNSWNWNFGEPSSTTDISSAQNPSYQYPAIGIKSVRLISGTDKGCIDTVTKQIEIYDKPPLSVSTKDTLMCFGDTTQLQAFGTGNFSWTPVDRIRGEKTATPEVWPSVTTTYTVQLDDNGCINTETVQVRVVKFVTLEVMKDTTICLTDTIKLNATTNGLQFLWEATPSSYIENPTLLSPKVKPVAASTTYKLTARIGKSCIDEGEVVVTTVPYPIVNAGIDTTICFDSPAQLNGQTDGTQYFWTPTQNVSNPNSLNPTVRPLDTTAYILTALKPASGCPKPMKDTVVVNVLPDIVAFAGRDTAVVLGQPLQLLATGGTSYVWSPGTGLSSTTIANPIGMYNGDLESIRYKVLVRNGICADSAYVTVKVFKTPPQIFIPTGFTPNNDSRNDKIRPIAVGITKIEYFRIFNRWGQLVFSSTSNGEGWDGKVKGKEQGSGVYAWVVKAVDYTGKEFFAKGTLTLIR